MSYATGTKPKNNLAQGMGNNMLNGSTDLESSDPLLSSALNRQITASLTQIKANLKKLEDQHRNIGTSRDTRSLRAESASLLN